MKDKFNIVKFMNSKNYSRLLTEDQDTTGGVDFGDAYKNKPDEETQSDDVSKVKNEEGGYVPNEYLKDILKISKGVIDFERKVGEGIMIDGNYRDMTPEQVEAIEHWYYDNTSEEEFTQNAHDLVGKKVDIIDIAEPSSESDPDVRTVTITRFREKDSGRHEFDFDDGTDAILFAPEEWETFLGGDPVTLHPDEVLMQLDVMVDENEGLDEELEVTKEGEGKYLHEEDIAHGLAYQFKDDEDMTLAGMIDGLIIKNQYEGDYDKFEEMDGIDERDEIIEQLFQGFNEKLKKLTS